MASPHLILVGHGPGTGHGIAKAFSAAGYASSLISRNPVDLASLAPLTGPVFQAAADAGDAAGLAEAIARCEGAHGPADALVYNAVAFRMGMPSQVAVEDLMADVRVNVGGALAAAQAVLPGMRARGAGTLLFTGGGWALYPAAGVSSTAIGKAGQRHLALMLAEELAGSGVRAGTLLIMGQVQAGTAFDPGVIGQAVLGMCQRSTAEWMPEVRFVGG